MVAKIKVVQGHKEQRLVHSKDFVKVNSSSALVVLGFQASLAPGKCSL